jgi:hypothetical protein
MGVKTPGCWIPQARWQRAVIYQNHLWISADANGDGVGDLRGIREHVRVAAS